MSDSEYNTIALYYVALQAKHIKQIQSNILREIIDRIGQTDTLDKPLCYHGLFVPDTTLLDKSDFAMMTKLSSGETKTRSKKHPSSNIVNMVMNRQKGEFSGNTRCSIYNRHVPNKFDILFGYPNRIYCSGFTKDGQHFITASHDKKLKIYNSGNGSYNIEKSIDFEQMGRDITDLDCSPDNEHFVCSTTSPVVNLWKVAKDCNEQIPLVVDNTGGILSVSFSADGRELLCGSFKGIIYIYDVESQRTTLKFSKYKQNMNSVRFADDSNNILYTAGTDGILKLWDHRILSVSCSNPVGYFAGHLRPIMYVDPRGDGRHVITHSTDQTIKLWDVRVLSSSLGEDYGKSDTSIMTYKGHTVVESMVPSVAESRIPCRFSPVETTGQRYIYTGCSSGRVVVFDALTGEAVQQQAGESLCIRHVSWHPTRNEILSTGENGLVDMWTYMDPNDIMEPEQIERDRKHFNSFKFQDGFLVNPDRRCHAI